MRLPSRGEARGVSATIAVAVLILAGTAAFEIAVVQAFRPAVSGGPEGPHYSREMQETARPGAPRQDSFDEMYLRGQRANAAIKTLTAQFTETTTSSLLTRPLVSRGRLAVERPSRVVLRYSDPEKRVVLIDGNRMTMSWPSHNVRQTTDIGTAQGRVQKYFVNGTAAELRGQFDIEEHDGSDRPGTYHVTMVPKRKQIREALARLDLWVLRSTLLLDAMRMTFANGDTKLMTFDEVAPNVGLEPGTFSIER